MTRSVIVHKDRLSDSQKSKTNAKPATMSLGGFYPMLLVELKSSGIKGCVALRKVFKAAFLDAGCNQRMLICMIHMHACRLLHMENP